MTRLATYAATDPAAQPPQCPVQHLPGSAGHAGVAVSSLPFRLLLLASACLYCGGMVWNDYFDREQDRRERGDRPIPSGKVAPQRRPG